MGGSGITGPKSVCPWLGKAKTQNDRVWSKEKFIDQEDTSQEDGIHSGSSNLP